jgi:hypothetical protein
MNQTRVFLIFAWLMVATLLWMEWGKEAAAPPATAETTQATTSTVPDASGAATTSGVPSVPTVPTVPTSPASMSATPAPAPSPGAARPSVTVTTDVLKVVLDGGELRQADLLKYPSTAAAGSTPVRLFDTDAARYFVAQSGWVSSAGPRRAMRRASCPGDRPDVRVPPPPTARRAWSCRSSGPAPTASPSAAPTRSSAATTSSDVRDDVVNAGARRGRARLPPAEPGTGRW